MARLYSPSEYAGIRRMVTEKINYKYGTILEDVNDIDVEGYVDASKGIKFIHEEIAGSKHFAKEAAELIYEDVYSTLLESERINEDEGIEEKNQVVELDKVQLFQDLADIESSLADAFSRLYVYKNQYISNPNIKAALSKVRLGVNSLLQQVTATISGMGIENDEVREEPTDDIM